MGTFFKFHEVMITLFQGNRTKAGFYIKPFVQKIRRFDENISLEFFLMIFNVSKKFFFNICLVTKCFLEYFNISSKFPILKIF